MDMQQIRINNLRRVIAKFNSAADFGREKDISPSYLSQLLKKHRSFGEKAARNIELKAGLEKLSLDQPIAVSEEKRLYVVGSRQENKDNGIPLIKKSNISAYLAGDHIPTKWLPDATAAIRQFWSGSKNTFAYTEQVPSVPAIIIPGETIIVVDPMTGVSATGRARYYLFRVGHQHLVGHIEETAAGMMLTFDNPAPGWDSIPVGKQDCIGRVLATLENK